MDNDDDAAFPKLGAPARRALSAAGYTRLDQLAQVSERDLKTRRAAWLAEAIADKLTPREQAALAKTLSLLDRLLEG